MDSPPPDKSLYDLLSITQNPHLSGYTEEQLIDLVRTLRQHASSPPTLTSKLISESDGIKPRGKTAAQRKAVLDTL
jgi:hypothetical protein